MICDKCGKNLATTHYKSVINGNVTEVNLCNECASQYKNPSIFNNNLTEMLSTFFGDLSSDERISTVAKCPCCAATFSDIAKFGKMGCSECYKIFGERLIPTLQRMHGQTKHVGKTPNSHTSKVKRKIELTNDEKISQLKIELKTAIDNEEYEKAATIRDEIKSLEGK